MSISFHEKAGDAFSDASCVVEAASVATFGTAHVCPFAVQQAAAGDLPSRLVRNSGMSGGLRREHRLEAQMNKLALSSAVVLFLLAPAHGQSVGEKTGVNSALGISPTTQDFVTEAANSDLLEIAAAKLALEKGNVDAKKFAERMITDHTKTTADIKAMVESGDVKAEIPATLDSAQQSKLDKLRDVKESNFASQYDSMQVRAHKDAVSLFERYSRSGDDPKLKDWAGKTLPTLRHHLEMAEALKDGKGTVGTSR
jgi:putative membrane protein